VPEISTLSDGTSVERIVVEGEVVDPADALELYEAICWAVRRRAEAVEVDLAGVDLFGSVGINALLQGRQEAQNLGCSITVVAASAIVRRV